MKNGIHSWRFGLMSLAVLCSALLFAGTASARKYGPKTITSDTTLSEDQFGSVIFGASNITLDCAGFQVHISGTTPNDCGGYTQAKCGIVAHQKSNITIKNCQVIGEFGVGIAVVGAFDARVETSRVAGAFTGYHFRSNTRLVGFSLDADVCRFNGYEITDSLSTQLHYAWATGNILSGFAESDSIGTVYDQDGRARDNGGGYQCVNCRSTLYGSLAPGSVGVTASNNGSSGILVLRSFDVRVANSTIDGNGTKGVWFSQVRTTLSGIVSGVFDSSGFGNGECDAVSEQSPGDIWRSNSFATFCGNFQD